MEKNVNELLLERDPTAKSLVNLLFDNQEMLDISNAYLYHSFPLYKEDDDSSTRVNVLLFSENYGITLFECGSITDRELSVANEHIVELSDRLEQTFSQVYSRLIKSKLLRKSPQDIKFPIHQILYLPNLNAELATHDNSYFKLCITLTDLQDQLTQIKLPQPLDQAISLEALAVLEGSKGICKPQNRKIADSSKKTKGSIIQEIELSIHNFDRDQKRAALNIIDGPQRIRGLAGTGKTIILTWKAALIHLQDPEAEIIYTFYTKSLYDLVKTLITRFYRQYAEKDPNWSKVKVLHAWGGQNIPGVYYNVCSQNNIRPKSFGDAKVLGGNVFDKICQQLLEFDLKRSCDYLLMDEAQDFSVNFYRLCLNITNSNRLIWGYDECQNIFDIEIQDTKKTFGKDKHGKFCIDLEKAPAGTRNDIVLHKCYRNPREVIFYAFAIGLGLYNSPILQMPEDNDHWTDLGFRVLEGNSRTGALMRIERPEENTPLIMNEQYGATGCIMVESFESIENECRYVVNSILEDLKSELLPDDILIISLDDYNSRTYFEWFESLLNEHDILTFNLQTAPAVNTTFKVAKHITLSTVYRAKGNESASVYIVGIDSPFALKDSIVSRNKIFTAITRTKGWVTITGIGKSAECFKQEFELAKSKYPYLEFNMPDRGSLKNFQRDLSESQAELNQAEKLIADIARKQSISIDDVLEKLSRSKHGKTK